MTQDLVPFQDLRPIERRAILALLDAPGRPGQRRRMLEYGDRASARRPLPGSN